MSGKNCIEGGQRALANRAGVSRKLLARKARANASTQIGSACVEDEFPCAKHATRFEPSDATFASFHSGGASAACRLRLGKVQPNPNTVVGTIVSIVAERGEVTRADLIDQMRSTSFPHPTAKPHDQGWCQGYVAGAIRQGFLAPVCEGSADIKGERFVTLVQESSSCT